MAYYLSLIHIYMCIRDRMEIRERARMRFQLKPLSASIDVYKRQVVQTGTYNKIRHGAASLLLARGEDLGVGQQQGLSLIHISAVLRKAAKTGGWL